MKNIIDTSKKHSRCMRSISPVGYEKYNEDWFLTAKGDMFNVWSDYEIGCEQLCEDYWILHCAEKRWFDANTFIPAYFEACRRCGVKTVCIRIDY